MTTEPGDYGADGHEPSGDPADGFVRRVLAGFRRWRNTRPFWGGLLVILSGALILLSEKAPVSVIIHIGLQGIAGYLIPAVLLLCGLLLLLNPVQRTFYALLAIVLALGSWITSNFGGFFVGMLLGLIGGSLAFAWEQRDGQGQRDDTHRGGLQPPAWLRQRIEHSHRLSSLFGGHDDDTAELSGSAGDESRGAANAGRSQSERGGGYRALAASTTALSLLFVLGPLPTHHGGSVTPVRRSADPLGFSAAPRSDLTADSAVLTGLRFGGITRVQTAHGNVAMLEFTMTSLMLAGARIHTAIAGINASAKAISVALRGSVVLVATKISGVMHGKHVSYSTRHPPSSLPEELTLTSMVTRDSCLTASTVRETGMGVAPPGT